MAIEFVNIKTGEKRKLSDPHQIGAFINSSDLHVNSNLGQDFGWRLSPEIVRRAEKMRQDSRLIGDLAYRLGIGVEDITVIHLVNEISREDGLKERVEQPEEENRYKAEYEKELEELRKKDVAAKKAKADAKKKEAEDSKKSDKK